MSRLPRKIKKKVINVFGKGTYQGIIGGYLFVDNYNGSGCRIMYTGKEMRKRIYFSGQRNPYIIFKKVWVKT